MISVYECIFCSIGVEYDTQDLQEHNEFNCCKSCFEKPYSKEHYEDAKKQGLDLDDWNDYCKYYGVGEEPNYDDM